MNNITVISRLRWLSPFSACGTTFLLKGSMSLDFRVAALPYKSSSFATPDGGTMDARQRATCL